MATTSPFGTLMSRLGGLKNVSGRKVLPGAEYLENLEQPPVDVSGTAQPPVLPPENQPVIADEFGLQPQGNDVRANLEVPPMEAQNEPNFISRLGSALNQYRGNLDRSFPKSAVKGQKTLAQTPPIETAQVDMQEGLPPETASEEQALKQAQPSVENVPKEQVEQGIEQKEPLTYAENGSVQAAYNNPELTSELSRLLGQEISPEAIEEAKSWEKVLSDYNEENLAFHRKYTEREQEIKDRIDSRNLTPHDQFIMALALLAPAAIAGLTMGKSGFFNVLAGGAGAYSNILQQKAKEKLLDEQKLDELALSKLKGAKERVGTAKEISDIKARIAKEIPKNALREEFLKNGKVIDGKLVYDTGDPLLPLLSNKIRDPKDITQYKSKVMPVQEKRIGNLKNALSIADEMTQILDKFEAQKFAEKIPYAGVAAKGLKAFIPGWRDTFVNDEGKEVKFADYYSSLRERLLDNYRQLQTGQGKSSKHMEEHFFREIPDPFTRGAFVGGQANIGQTKTQLKSFVKGVEDSVYNELESSGVYTKPLRDELSKTFVNEEKRKTKRAQEAVKQVKGGK